MSDGTIIVNAALSPVSTSVEHFAAPAGWTLTQIIETVNTALVSNSGTRAFVNGVPIPRELWEDTTPPDGSTVLVRLVPATGEEESDKVLRTVLFIGLTALSWHVKGIWGAIVQIGGTFGIDALVPLSVTQADTPAAEEMTRTPSLSGARNQIRPYGPVPLVLGRHRITPPLAAHPYVELDEGDQYLRMLMTPGYGPMTISDMQIGETPLTSYEDVEVETHEGTSGEDAMELFPDTVSTESLSVLLKQVDEYTTRRTQENVDEIGLELTFPQGLVQINSDGTRESVTVALEADYKLVGNGGWKGMGDTLEVPTRSFGVYGFVSGAYSTQIVIDKRSGRISLVVKTGTAVNVVDSGKYMIARIDRGTGILSSLLRITDLRDPALTQYGAGHFAPTNDPDMSHVKIAAGKFDPSPPAISKTGRSASLLRLGQVIRVTRGQYDVRVKRITADSADTTVLDEVYWTALRSITNEDPISLDSVAKIVLRIRATNQLQGVVDQFSCIVHSIMKDWDAGTSAWVERKTSNPASIFRYLLQGPMNKRSVADARINLTALQTWHVWCVANGHEFNGVINSSTTLFQLLKDVAAAGRASPTMQDGKFSVVQDVSQTTPRQLFTPKNSWGFGASRAFIDLPHALKVQFINGLPTHELRVTPANVEVGDVFALKLGLWGVLSKITVSAATADDSYNDATEDLSVFAAGQLVHIEGFTLAANNGIKTVVSAAANKLVVAENLADEAAGDIVSITAAVAGFEATAATVANVTAGLKASWDASPERVAELYDATDDTTHLTLKGNRPSAQYDIEGYTTDVGGTDAQTLVISTQSDVGSWEREEEIVYDDGYALVAGGGDLEATKFEEIELFGVASADQAWKTGRYHLAVLRLRPEVYTLSVDVEHIVCNRGDLVRVQHDVPLFGLSSGRVKSRTTNGGNVETITLDETVTMVGGSNYAVRYRQADNTISVENVDTNVGEQTTLTFTVPVLIADAPDVGDLVSFGVQGSETVEMIVQQIEMGPELSAKLTLVDAAPAVHTADSGSIPAYDPQITIPPRLEELAPAVPEIVSLRSGEVVMVRHKDGTFENRILAAVRPGEGGPVPASKYEAQFKLSDSARWCTLPDMPADATDLSITPVADGESYDVRVRAVSAWNVTSLWDTVTDYVVLGNMELSTEFSEVYDAGLTLSGGDFGNAYIENGVLYVPVNQEETWAEHFSSRDWTNIQDQIDAGFPIYRQPSAPSGGFSNELPDPVDADLFGAWLNAGVQGVADDWSRAGDDMTAAGGPTWDSIAGVTLDGATQYLERTEADWRGSDEVGTISALINRAGVGTNDAIFASVDTATGKSLMFYVGSGNYLYVEYYDGAVINAVRSSTALAAGVWYHVALVCDGITWKLYIDGIEETLIAPPASGSNTGTWLADIADRDNVTIGVLHRALYAEYFHGSIKDIRYYDRAMTTAEVLTLATGGLGAWEATVDLGAITYFERVKTSITLDKTSGVVAVTPSLSVSVDLSTWVDYAGSSEINVTGYRYIRVRYDFVAADGTGIVGVSNVQLEVDARTRIDSALAALLLGDAPGTVVTFGIAFARVVAIAVTPKGTSSYFCVVNFDFTQDNPTTFKVLMFDEAGNRVSGDATYVARGY